MKIFQGVNEIAGQMGMFAGELRKNNCDVTCYNTFHSYLGYEDNLINLEREELNKNVDTILTEYDVYHFHYAQTLNDDFSDLKALQANGKKAVMHHWGNDVRFHEQAKERNPFAYTGDSPANEVMHERLTAISKVIKEAIVQDYEVYEYVKPYYDRVHVLPIAVQFEKVAQTESVSNDIPLLLHAPTNPLFKGTEHVEAAVHRLAKEFSFEYVRIEQKHHEEALDQYKQADLIIDQVLCGSYGLLSVEAMAMGKPVVTYVRDDLLPTFPEIPPIINANPANLYEKVRYLLKYPDVLNAYGRQGRRYAKKYHDIKVVAEQLMSIYEGLKPL